MNTEKVPQLCHSPGSCQGSLPTQPLKRPLISRVPLAGLCAGEFSSVVLQAQERATSMDKKQSFRTQYCYIQNRAFLHRNLYSHRDLYIQVAHAFVFDGAGTLGHNSLVTTVITVLRVYASKVARKFVTISFNFASVWSEIFPSVLWEELSEILTQQSKQGQPQDKHRSFTTNLPHL